MSEENKSDNSLLWFTIITVVVTVVIVLIVTNVLNG